MLVFTQRDCENKQLIQLPNEIKSKEPYPLFQVELCDINKGEDNFYAVLIQ